MFVIFIVDGGWSDWQNMTNCSTTCGEDVITQQRTCTQPSPSCGGRECLGENTTNVSCDNCCPGNNLECFDVYMYVLFVYTCTSG